MVLRQWQELNGASYHQVSDADDSGLVRGLISPQTTELLDKEFYSFKGLEKSLLSSHISAQMWKQRFSRSEQWPKDAQSEETCKWEGQRNATSLLNFPLDVYGLNRLQSADKDNVQNKWETCCQLGRQKGGEQRGGSCLR